VNLITRIQFDPPRPHVSIRRPVQASKSNSSNAGRFEGTSVSVSTQTGIQIGKIAYGGIKQEAGGHSCRRRRRADPHGSVLHHLRWRVRRDRSRERLEARRDITVLFTDIQMPGSMDGLKLAAAVRDRWPPILIVATSGHVSIGEDDLPHGARFLPKPYSPTEILTTLRELTAA
jgi:CheY-like chemotaxis protein